MDRSGAVLPAAIGHNQHARKRAAQHAESMDSNSNPCCNWLTWMRAGASPRFWHMEGPGLATNGELKQDVKTELALMSIDLRMMEDRAPNRSPCLFRCLRESYRRRPHGDHKAHTRRFHGIRQGWRTHGVLELGSCWSKRLTRSRTALGTEVGNFNSVARIFAMSVKWFVLWKGGRPTNIS